MEPSFPLDGFTKSFSNGSRVPAPAGCPSAPIRAPSNRPDAAAPQVRGYNYIDGHAPRMTVIDSVPKDARTIKGDVDPDGGQVTRDLMADQAQTIIYESLNGGRAVGNRFSTRAKIASALGIPADGIVNPLLQAVDRPQPCEVIESPAFKAKSLPVMVRMASSASGLELTKLSTMISSWPAFNSSTQVWLPMYPAPPVTRTFIWVSS